MSAEFDEAKWFDQKTTASRPGGVEISYPKLEWFRRKLNWGHRFLGVGQVPAQRWAVHLEKGLAEPALVVRAKPLIVAVYTAEFDCVAMLRFVQGVPGHMTPREGDRLLSVNTFERRPMSAETRRKGKRDLIASSAPPKAERTLERDLILGELSEGSIWFNVHPVIADFLSEDAGAIEASKAEIGEWERLEELSAAYLKRFPDFCRNGNPYLSHLPA